MKSPTIKLIQCRIMIITVVIVSQLDMRIRLCIRDSLFRLARSAMERQSASDRSSTSTSNKDDDEVSADEGTRNHDR